MLEYRENKKIIANDCMYKNAITIHHGSWNKSPSAVKTSSLNINPATN